MTGQRQMLCVFSVTLTTLFAVTMPAVASEPVHSLHQTYFAGEATRLDIELVLGNLEVEGTDERNVEVEVRLYCERRDSAKCRRSAERIRLRPRLSGHDLQIGLENTPRGRARGVQATMVVRVPRHMALEVDLAGGDVTVGGVRGDIEIDSGGGGVTLRGEQSLVASFKADVGFGSGDLWLRDSHVEASGLPRSIKWQGSGTQRIEIDLGGGTITARLD